MCICGMGVMIFKEVKMDKPCMDKNLVAQHGVCTEWRMTMLLGSGTFKEKKSRKGQYRLVSFV
jgi:hypothetical protein